MKEVRIKDARPDSKHPLVKVPMREFIDTGLLWFVNRMLHVFGFALSYEEDLDTGEVTDLYICRTIFRGYGYSVEDAGYLKVADYLLEAASGLHEEIQEASSDKNCLECCYRDEKE